MRQCRLWAFAVLAGASAAAGDTVQTVMVTGDPIQGAPGSVFVRPYFAASIADDGRVAYGALMSGPVTSAILAGPPESLGLVAISRGLAPGPGAPADYWSFGDPIPAGTELAYSAALVNHGGSSSLGGGLFATVSGTPMQVARADAPAPGTEPGTTFVGFNALAYNAAGQIAFGGRVYGPAMPPIGDDGIWVGRPGSVALAARSGAIAPGTSSQFQTFDSVVSLSSTGRVAFKSYLSPSGAQSVWAGPVGTLSLVAVAGGAAPGTAPGVVFSTLSGIHIGAGGHAAVTATLAGPGVTSTNRDGIWLGQPGDLRLIARTGSQAPGTPPGVVFLSFGGDIIPAITAAGRAVFMGYLTGPGVTNANGQGLWLWNDGVLSLLARKGDPFPGMPEGVVYGGMGATNYLNDVGGAVFTAALAGPGIGPTNNQVLCTLSPGSTTPRIVVRTGEPFTVRSGDVRTADLIVLTQTVQEAADGGPKPLNNSGQIAFSLRFTDQTYGVFVAMPDAGCYANCDGSTAPPVLNVNDFLCYANRYAAGDPAANCDGSTAPPTLNVADFICFMNRYAAGCP